MTQHIDSSPLQDDSIRHKRYAPTPSDQGRYGCNACNASPGVPPAEPGVKGPKLAHSVEKAAELIGVCRRTLYELMTCGRLPSVKIGRRRLVRHADLVQFVAELEEVAV